MTSSRTLPVFLTVAVAVGWLYLWLDWLTFNQLSTEQLWGGFGLSMAVVAWWLDQSRKKNRVIRLLVYSVCFFPVWQISLFALGELGSSDASEIFTVWLYWFGLFFGFLIGLLWVCWFTEKKSRVWQKRRLEYGSVGKRVAPLHAMHLSIAGPIDGLRVWNPLDMDAWYYGKQRQKLRQSLTVLVSYFTLFALLLLLLLQISGCQELYEMPAGGGEQKPNQPVVKVQRVIKKKIIFNPLSKVIAKVPPIEEIKLQLMEITKHAYTVGYGKGAGAGFAG